MKIVWLVLLLADFGLGSLAESPEAPKLIVQDAGVTVEAPKLTTTDAPVLEAQPEAPPRKTGDIAMDKNKSEGQGLIKWSKLNVSKQEPYVQSDPSGEEGESFVGSDKFPCNQKLLDGFGLNGYPDATVNAHKYCPSITRNCCTNVDQDLTMNFWKSRDQNNVDRYFRAQKLMISYVLGYAQEGEKLARAYKDAKDECGQAAAEFMKLDTSRLLIEKMLDEFHRSVRTMATVRTGFYCHLCDYNVQSFLQASTSDMSSGALQVSAESCQSMVNGGISASYYSVTYLKKYLESMGTLIGCKAQEKEKLVFEVSPADVASASSCFETKDRFSIDACMSYCSAFKLTRPAPLLDGYVEQIYKFFQRFFRNKSKVFQQPELNVFLLSPGYEESAVQADMLLLAENKEFFRTMGIGSLNLDNFKTSPSRTGGASLWKSLEYREYYSYLAGTGLVRAALAAVLGVLLWQR